MDIIMSETCRGRWCNYVNYWIKYVYQVGHRKLIDIKEGLYCNCYIKGIMTHTVKWHLTNLEYICILFSVLNITYLMPEDCQCKQNM
jgi:hypothetical protein